ncbi:MAG: hypothetical protein K5681_07660 [Treponema sp.]|nr:hypothetical protein [Treponema sp.]
MTLIIPHPTEELRLIEFQKELIKAFFTDERIIYSATPLWIELPENFAVEKAESLKKLSKSIEEVKLGPLQMTEREIYLKAHIKTLEEDFFSKLTLVRIHSGKIFTASEQSLLAEKKEPVNILKIFRLGIEEKLSPAAKALSASVWVKLNS